MKYLNDFQLQAFFRVVKQSPLRDELAFSLMLFLGLRVGELVKIRLEDINFQAKQIEIQGLKNGRCRVYTLDARLWRKLLKYIKNLPSNCNSWLFPSRANVGEHVSTAAFWRLFKIYCAEAGLDSRYSVHSLRHTTAIQLAENDANPIDIMQWLRHRSITSTQVYFEEVRRLETEEIAKQTFSQFI